MYCRNFEDDIDFMAISGIETSPAVVMGTIHGMYDRIHFAVMAIESAARKMHVSGRKMHDRLKAQNLIHDRLLARYDDLHTQSLDWVADDTVTALKNWEAGV